VLVDQPKNEILKFLKTSVPSLPQKLKCIVLLLFGTVVKVFKFYYVKLSKSKRKELLSFLEEITSSKDPKSR